MNLTPVVKQLLIINIIFFIGSQIPSTHAYDLFALYFPESINFRFWQIITHMFMHAPMPNITHIAFNMFALFSFGTALEHLWGGKKFLFFYISCGLGAALLHIGVNYLEFHKIVDLLITSGVNEADIYSLLAEGKYDKEWGKLIGEENIVNYNETVAGTVVGASGAIYGLLTAFAFMFPKAELMLMFIPVPIKAKYFVPGLLLIDLFLGLRGSSIFGAGSTGIAHFAHIGGAVTGFIMMWFWKKNEFNRNRWN